MFATTELVAALFRSVPGEDCWQQGQTCRNTSFACLGLDSNLIARFSNRDGLPTEGLVKLRRAAGGRQEFEVTLRSPGKNQHELWVFPTLINFKLFLTFSRNRFHFACLSAAYINSKTGGGFF